MTTKNFREHLRARLPLYGLWRTLPGAALTEMVRQGGYDLQIFDLEHGALGWPQIDEMVRVNNLAGGVSFIRLGDRSPIAAQRALDTGAAGIVYPQVSSYEEVESLAKNLSFAPEGCRGFNPFVAGFGYGSISIASLDRPLFVPIVESAPGIADLPRIASHPAVDIVYLGAYDLSVQLGCPGEMTNPRLLGTLRQAIEVCNKYGKAVGLMAMTAESVAKWASDGATVFIQGVDGGILSNALRVKKL